MLKLLIKQIKKRNANDQGDIVQTVLMIAGFAVVAILIVTWVGTAILNKGADASECLEKSGSYTNKTIGCTEKHSVDHSFTKDTTYTSRY